MKRVSVLPGVFVRVLGPVLLLALAGCSITHAIRSEDGQRIAVDQMIAEVSNVPLILVGERHDEPSHHELQLRLMQNLYYAGKPLAIGLEMFRVDSQGALDNWVSGITTEAEFVKIYQDNWHNLSWDLYQDIFRFAREHGIPMIALNVPQQIIEKVVHAGFSGLSNADLIALPPRSTDPLSDASMQFMKAYFPDHGKNGDAFHRLCEAQVLRNRVMAKAIIRYLKNHPGSTMIVLAGGVHVWKAGGIPAELGNLPYKAIVPRFSAIGTDDQDTGGTDYLLD